MRIKLSLAVFLVAAFCFVTDSPAEISNRVVAMVGNDVITLYELNNRIQLDYNKTVEEVQEQEGENFFELRREIIDAIIDEKLTQVKIQELHYEATEEEIDQQVEKIKTLNKLTQEALLAELKNQGITYAAFRKEIRQGIERRRLFSAEVTDKTVILESELEEYYKGHQDAFKVPEKVRIACIFFIVKDQEDQDEIAELTKKGEEVLARLKNGEDFGALAKEFSQIGADNGGDMGDLDTSQFDTEIKNVIAGLKEGEISGLVNRKGVIQIIKLLKREGGNTRAYAEVRDSIYETIEKEKQQERYNEWIKGLRDKSYTKIIF
jgi:peptidyl-prolyl cis-trans isomerase SurA